MSIKNIFFLAASAAVCIGLLAAPAEARFKVTASKGSPDLPNVPCNEELGGTVYFDDAQKVMFYCRGREVTTPQLVNLKTGWVPLGYPEEVLHDKGPNAGQKLTTMCLEKGCEVLGVNLSNPSLPVAGEMVDDVVEHGHKLYGELDIRYEIAFSKSYNPFSKTVTTEIDGRQFGYNPAPGSYKQPYPVYLDVNGDGRADQADRAGGEEGELRFFDGLRSPDHNRNALQNQRSEGEMAYWDGEGWVKISNNDWIINRNWDGKLDTFDAPKHDANSDSPRFTSCSSAIYVNFKVSDECYMGRRGFIRVSSFEGEACLPDMPGNDDLAPEFYPKEHFHEVTVGVGPFIYVCTATPSMIKPISGTCNEQVKGEMFYNPARAILEYCSGTQWVPVQTQLWYVINLTYMKAERGFVGPSMDPSTGPATLVASTVPTVETAIAPLANVIEGRYWARDCNGDPDNTPLGKVPNSTLMTVHDLELDRYISYHALHNHAVDLTVCEDKGHNVSKYGRNAIVDPSQNTSLTWEKCRQIPIATRPVACDLLEP